VKIATTTRTLYKTGAECHIVDEAGESKKVSKGYVSTSKITGYSTKAESDAKMKEIKGKKAKNG
jgi:hypothetical protein